MGGGAMLARFFIDRPVFAWVLSLVILLLGAVAAWTLPISQYPPITPPTVQVTAMYPGANAVVVADTVGAPIEEQVNGVEDMMYMSSQSTNDGSYTLTITFEIGTDPNMAQVLVQNRVALAMPQLPAQVQLQGVNTKKTSPDILLAVSLFSPDGRFDELFLSNYATINLQDELARIKGVGDIHIFDQRRCLHDPAGLHGRAVRQPVHPVRPDLAGAGTGRTALPDKCLDNQAAPGSQCRRSDGAAGNAGPREENHRSARGDALQHVRLGPGEWDAGSRRVVGHRGR
jgi:multidrug efflux pump